MARQRRRAQITFTAVAERQIDEIADPDAIHALDRALAALSVDPAMGTPIRGTVPELREYCDDVDAVRLIYYVTALRTVVVVAYLEAG
ncbi:MULTISPECIES: hypothetical protein [Kitasatospora]|uniref:Plasmid stabilization system protein ParE n=2 Tax=Kitasatospora TaxID=2063 RepID=A0ABT1J8R9_9ACTN|nr:hypothetical protein [Kitasatospora paracochleata]MCP2313838.1 plasmid stabilization system protein ParE [Kitasatospora paracochleata]